MAELHEIGGPEPVQAVVEVLEDLLNKARQGEVIAIAVGAVCHGRHTASVYTIGDAAIADLYHGIERCKARLLDAGWDG